MLNIVMLQHNRPKLTQQAIETLYRHTQTQFTLTVVDDASTDLAAIDKLEELSLLYNFHTALNPENRGTGWSRNRGISVSTEAYGRGGLLYLTDNDVAFQPHWWAAMEANLPVAHSLGFRLLGAYNHPYNRPHARWDGIGGFEILEYVSLGGLSWLLRWDTWDKFGPLRDTAKGVCQSEDWEFCQRMLKAGYKVGTVWPFVVHNTGRTNSFDRPSIGADVANPDVPGIIVE